MEPGAVIVPAMIPWQTSRQTNAMGLSWTESLFIENGLRCSRADRNYCAISHGTDWKTQPPSKNAKIEFKRGPTMDIAVTSCAPAEIGRTMAFAFRCLLNADEAPPDDTPISEFYARPMKHMICNVRYYEASHPTFGSRFAGDKPPLTIGDLTAMVRDALQAKTVRIPAKALRFDPRD